MYQVISLPSLISVSITFEKKKFGILEKSLYFCHEIQADGLSHDFLHKKNDERYGNGK